MYTIRHIQCTVYRILPRKEQQEGVVGAEFMRKNATYVLRNDPYSPFFMKKSSVQHITPSEPTRLLQNDRQ